MSKTPRKKRPTIAEKSIEKLVDKPLHRTTRLVVKRPPPADAIPDSLTFIMEDSVPDNPTIGEIIGTYHYDQSVMRVPPPIPPYMIEKKTVQYPADWVQAFKARFLPAWAKTRWPVRYTEQTFQALK